MIKFNNIEMSIAKTDQRIAKMYLHLGDRDDLSKKVFTEMQLTRKWVLAIVGDEWPLQRRRVLGCAVRVRNPYVDALSIAQVRALREVRMNQDEMAEEKKAEESVAAAITGNTVTAPLPGRIIEFKVKVGDTVKAGQEIVVLEAMKMENSVTTDYAGTVKQILAHPGDNVATDAVLVEIV